MLLYPAPSLLPTGSPCPASRGGCPLASSRSLFECSGYANGVALEGGEPVAMKQEMRRAVQRLLWLAAMRLMGVV